MIRREIMKLDVRLIVAGSKTVFSKDLTFKAIELWKEKNPDKNIGLIISGKVRGFGGHGIEYADKNNLLYTEYIPNWSKFRGDARIIMNKDMAIAGDELVAIYEKKNRGIYNLIRQMIRLGKPAWVMNFDILPLDLQLARQEEFSYTE
jgi:hypothetical protein